MNWMMMTNVGERYYLIVVVVVVLDCCQLSIATLESPINQQVTTRADGF